MEAKDLKVGMILESEGRVCPRHIVAVGKEIYVYTLSGNTEFFAYLDNLSTFNPVKKTKKVRLYRYVLQNSLNGVIYQSVWHSHLLNNQNSIDKILKTETKEIEIDEE